MSIWKLLVSKPTVLVQGADGKVGFEITSELIDHSNMTVKAGVKDPDDVKADKLIELGINVVPFQHFSPIALRAGLVGISKLVIIPPNRLDRVQAVQNIVDAAVHSNVKHIILISALGAKNAANLFADQFRQIEKIIEKSGISWTFLRCGLFMDNYLKSRSYITRGKLPLPTGQGKFAPIALSDVGEIVARIVKSRDHHYRIYELTGSIAMSGTEQASVFSSVLKRNITFIPVSIAKFKNELIKAGFQEWQINGFVEIYQLISEGKFDTTSTDAQFILGTPPRSLAQWIAENKYSLIFY